MDIDWLKLRPHNGDVKNAFEELICQLARTEYADKTKFFRVAAPDGGVEAYSILPDNSEYGWQAKFFSSLGDAQWKQLDKSFKQAFKTHPNLKKYFICVPLDRQEPRIDKKKFSMDRWNDKVKAWTAFAKKNGREIEFEYWGSSELFDKLSKPENQGKYQYWFGKDEFSDQWFKQKLEENIRNLGKRYTPEINFELSIGKIFEGLSRDEYFHKQFLSYLDDLLKKYNRAIFRPKEAQVKKQIEKIKNIINDFQQYCEKINFNEIEIIGQDSLVTKLREATETIYTLMRLYHQLNSPNKEGKRDDLTGEDLGRHIEYFRQLNVSIEKFTLFIKSPTVTLSNNPFLLLTGQAGAGKSHLLADIAKKRLKRNQYSILLLGQHFRTEAPWSQIKKLLQFNCVRDSFLGALNSKQNHPAQEF